MKYLLDTCAISEPRKPSPNQGFIEWLEDQIEDRLYLSALTIGEIRRGIYRLEPSRRRTELEEWLELLRKRFQVAFCRSRKRLSFLGQNVWRV